MRRIGFSGGAIEMEKTKTELDLGLHRCPFCHDSIAIDAGDAISVCRQCLARHHAACWSESSACASCGSGAALVDAERDASSPKEVAPTGDVARADRAQFATLARGASWLGAIGTLGVSRMIAAEVALARRRRRRGAPMRPFGALLRLLVPALLLAAASVVTAGAFAAADHAAKNPGWASFGDALYIFWFPSMVAPLVALATCVHVHAFRETVAGAESREIRARVAAGQTEPTRELVLHELARRDWRIRRAMDGLLTLGAILPVALFPLTIFLANTLGLAAAWLPLAALLVVTGTRAHGAIALADEHDAPRPPVK